MFNSSTQKSSWLFKDSAQLAEMRKKANMDYIKRQNVDVKYSYLLFFFKYIFGINSEEFSNL